MGPKLFVRSTTWASLLGDFTAVAGAPKSTAMLVDAPDLIILMMVLKYRYDARWPLVLDDPEQSSEEVSHPTPLRLRPDFLSAAATPQVDQNHSG
jgi:hypothetical protein